jgi:release factor glutamine methyltransferase
MKKEKRKWFVDKLPFWMKISRKLRPVISYFYTALYLHTRKKNALTKVAGMRLKTMLEVFHPKFFLSSRYFARYIENLPLKNKNVLDMGTGSGIAGIAAAKKGAKVTAVDLNALAVQLAQENARMHNLNGAMQYIESDLFARLDSSQKFDIITFNPPYYAGEPKNSAQAAFFAGENFSTIERFLAQAPQYLSENGRIIFILSSDMPLARIDKMIRKHGFRVAKSERYAHIFEYFYILKLRVI